LLEKGPASYSAKRLLSHHLRISLYGVKEANLYCIQGKMNGFIIV